MKKYFFRLILILFGFIIICIGILLSYISLILIDTPEKSDTILGIILIVIATFMGGVGGILISKFKMLD